MLGGMYENAKQAQLILILYEGDKRGFIVGAQMAEAAVTMTAQLAVLFQWE